MSSKYRFIDREGVYLVTSTVVGWADVFYQGYLPGEFSKQFSVLPGETGFMHSCVGVNAEPFSHDLFMQGNRSWNGNKEHKKFYRDQDNRYDIQECPGKPERVVAQFVRSPWQKEQK